LTSCTSVSACGLDLDVFCQLSQVTVTATGAEMPANAMRTSAVTAARLTSLILVTMKGEFLKPCPPSPVLLILMEMERLTSLIGHHEDQFNRTGCPC